MTELEKRTGVLFYRAQVFLGLIQGDFRRLRWFFGQAWDFQGSAEILEAGEETVAAG